MSFISKIILKKPVSEHSKESNTMLLTPNTLSYAEELERLKERVSYAYDNLDNVVDPILIDSWIYEINAAQLRYQFCLQQLKKPSGVLGTEKTGAV